MDLFTTDNDMSVVQKYNLQQISTHHDVIAEILETDLSFGDVIQLNVVSKSMQPLMTIGDQVIAEITPLDEIQQGDVVVIKRNHDYLTHRVIHQNHNTWITKGDNNVLPDPKISQDKIIGRVSIIKKGNHSINLLSKKWIYLNPLLAKLSSLESRAFSIHPYFRLPFRFTIRAIQSILF